MNLYTFDKSKTELTKAILPLLIILHHLSSFPGLSPFLFIGISLVSIFFFISGYGIMSSVLKNQDYFENFFQQRFLSVLIPYLLALGIQFIYSYTILNKTPYQLYLKNGISDLLPYSWFVIELLVIYTYVYLIFTLRVSNRFKIICIFTGTLVYYIVAYNAELMRYWYASSPAFVIGMTIKFYEKQIIIFLERKKHLFVLFFAIIALFILLNKLGFKDINSLMVCISFYLFMLTLKPIKNGAATVFFSKISYELYLLQGIAISIVRNFGSEYSTIGVVIIVLIIDIALSICLSKISKRSKEYLFFLCK